MVALSTRETFTAVCERDGESGWWVVTVAELPGIVTQGRNLVDARAMARDAIAIWNERSEDTFDVAVEARLAPGADQTRSRALEARKEAERAQQEAARATREAVRTLIEDQGLTIRDVSQLLGVSYQRVAQLAPSKTKAGRG